VGGADAVPPAFRALRQHPARAHLAHYPDDVALQLSGGVQRPVLVPGQEPDVGHSHRSGCRALLGLADGGHLLARGVVEATLVAVGAQQVGHLDPRPRPGGGGAGGAEVGVVGVGDDDEDAFDLGGGQGVGHGRAPARATAGRSDATAFTRRNIERAAGRTPRRTGQLSRCDGPRTWGGRCASSRRSCNSRRHGSRSEEGLKSGSSGPAARGCSSRARAAPTAASGDGRTLWQSLRRGPAARAREPTCRVRAVRGR